MGMFEPPFIGSEVIAAGAIRKHELRLHYRAVFPDVYVQKDAALTCVQEPGQAGSGRIGRASSPD